MARWAAFLERQGNPDAAWLTVDAGNYVDRVGQGGCSGKCQFLVSSYRDLHYDVLNLGQQEIWMGYETLKSLVDTTKDTKFVSANLIDLKTKKPLASPSVIKDYGNFRVGIIGLAYEGDFPKGSTMLDSSTLAVEPSIQAAKKYIPALRKKVNAIVVLCGLPSSMVDSLVKTVPGIDLVVSTGSMKTGETLSTLGSTRVIGTGSSGYSGHYAMIDFGTTGRDSLKISAYSDQLTEVYEERGMWADRLSAFNSAPPVTPAANVKSTPAAIQGKPAQAQPLKKG